MQTIHDYRQMGDPKDRLTANVQAARLLLGQLESYGFSLHDLAQTLEDDAVKKFVDPFNSLIASIESKRVKVTA